MNDIRIEARSNPERAQQVLAGSLGFGDIFADLMLLADHDPDHGWHDLRVVPFAPLSLLPTAKVLHYGLGIFEGHKAYGWPDGAVALFRPELNAHRLNASARRMRMPQVPVALQRQATDQLVDRIRAWVPRERGTSLYLRPTLIGVEPTLGVSPSQHHLYFIVASPVGAYFPKGFASIAVRVEEEQVRASRGGVGAAKTGGNYAAGLDGQQRAREQGFDQVLWLDCLERSYVEELNAMNLFAVVRGEIYTPPLGDTILAGITRQTILELCPALGLTASERPLAITELSAGIATGEVSELFAVGTAAIVTPIGTLGYRGNRLSIGDGKPGPIARLIYDTITDIQYGRVPDHHGWMQRVGSPVADHSVPTMIDAVA